MPQSEKRSPMISKTGGISHSALVTHWRIGTCVTDDVVSPSLQSSKGELTFVLCMALYDSGTSDLPLPCTHSPMFYPRYLLPLQ